MIYKAGLENFINERYQLVKDKKVGLVTNHTGLDSNFDSNIDLFYRHPDINLVALYGPEHGVRGKSQAGMKVKDSKDIYTGLPVYSLYAKNKKPGSEILKDIDVLVYDIQDIGVRFYTYISTLFYCLESCHENNKELIVLDRLNPLGRKTEGNIRELEYKSFISLYPIPHRHGKTVGELALWANEYFDYNVNLNIVRVEGWKGEYFDQLDLLWIPPSPNIPHFKTALHYPITCLFEGTNISEGRGTTNPFEFIGAPWIDPFILTEYINKLKLTGLAFRAVFFEPTFSKHKSKECGGVQVMITDRDKVNSIQSGLALLKAFFDLYPEHTEFILPENKNHRVFFDLLMGTDQVRKGLVNNIDINKITKNWHKETEEFKEITRDYILY